MLKTKLQSVRGNKSGGCLHTTATHMDSVRRPLTVRCSAITAPDTRPSQQQQNNQAQSQRQTGHNHSAHHHQHYSHGKGATQHIQPQRVFVFDSDGAQEVLVQPHEDTVAAEQLLKEQEQQGRRPSSPNGNGQPGAIPLRAVALDKMGQVTITTSNTASASPSVSVHTSNGYGPQVSSDAGALVAANGNGSAALAKGAEMQRQLVEQLQAEQARVVQLRQYEAMYKEWRMKAEKLEADISLLHRLVAEKDAELSHGYKLLEASAGERSRLRNAFQASQEKAKSLQLALAEAQAKRQLGSPLNYLKLGNGNGNGNALPAPNGNGNGSSQAQALPQNNIVAGPAVHKKMASTIEELTVMAQSVAHDMKYELRTVASRSPSPGPIPCDTPPQPPTQPSTGNRR